VTTARPAFDVVAMRRDDAMLDALARRAPGMASVAATCTELRLLRALAADADVDLPPYVPVPAPVPIPLPTQRPVLSSVPPPGAEALPATPAVAAVPVPRRAAPSTRRTVLRRSLLAAAAAAVLSAGALLAAECDPVELSASVLRALTRLDDGSVGARR
jgi:hypothetical protein